MSPDAETLAEIQLAILHQKVIKMHYKKADDPNATIRKIEPAVLCSSQANWILVGWCYLRNELRTFRVDRMEQFQVLQDQFEDRNINLDEYLSLGNFDVDQ